MSTTEHHPTIVVGYDGSDAARAALALARRRAGDSGRVFVVHAFDMPADMLGFPNYDRLLEERQSHGRRLLDEVAPEGRCGPQLEPELIGGPPAEAIDEIARAREADEIIVGARGLSPVRASLGSVSSRLLHRADRPVIVIPHAAVGRLRDGDT